MSDPVEDKSTDNISKEIGKGNVVSERGEVPGNNNGSDSNGSGLLTPSASTCGEDKSLITDNKGDDPSEGSSSSPPSTAIKKRSSVASQRNYRSSQAHLSGNSDDSDDEGDSSSSKSSKKMKNNDDNNAEATAMEVVSGESAERPSEGGATPMANEESNDSSDWAMAIGHSSPRFSPRSDEDDGGGRIPVSSLQRLLYRVRDAGNSDDDHVQFEEVRPESDSSSTSTRRRSAQEESSSDTSDCVLEDLDEAEPEAAPTAAAESSTAEREASERDARKPPTGQTKKTPKKKHETPKVLLKPKPKYDWSGPLEIKQREMGYGGRKFAQSAQIFRSRFYGSLYSAERLELWQKLDGHHGCVNCLNFNYAGTKLASGSDDLFIKIWNYGLGKSIASFHSGHRANVFQAKFLPLVGLDTMIVSCARDNQVRLSELNTSGQVWCSRKLAQHRGPAHKLSVSPETPHVVLSAGEDAVVYSIDIREDKAQKILHVKEGSKKVSLYSIHQNPLYGNEFCVSGRDEFVRIYDTRKLSTSTVPAPRNNEDPRDAPETYSSPLKKFCPHHLRDNRHRPNVTAAVYNYNGREIVASYNDENIYLFDATHSDGADCIKMYEGHRNSATIKGINFFGDKSQFVVSGSDCGHIFLWDKETECIVNFLRGDENGVVNCLEPHPTSPILATSGLDDDVKIWIPTKEKDPLMGPNNLDLSSTVHKNIKSRTEELERQPESMDGRIIQALWNHIRQANRERRREQGLQLSDSDDSSGMEDDDDDDNDAPRGVECRVS